MYQLGANQADELIMKTFIISCLSLFSFEETCESVKMQFEASWSLIIHQTVNEDCSSARALRVHVPRDVRALTSSSVGNR